MKALYRFALFIDGLNEKIGKTVSWLAVAMLVVQFAIVLMRYVFGINYIWFQESILYMHGFLFMLAAGYALLHDEHVRVDIFYREAAQRTKAMVNLLGSCLLLLPFMVLIFYTSFGFVINSWSDLEGSTETSGIQGIYLLKSAILIFAVLVGLQGISLAIHSLRVLRGEETLNDEQEEAVL
ncbi:MAG: TRAP-type mannitol/chloroaromatic compound transport system permease small subunit [Parvibaculaceae bacterium]|jgi:TRAP-type mannitol/chloroaromatic compound transport system permease small subunit|tara:strand:- start:41 stop:583 length:543 start_codon:yes stop_codon:yes gene_type:complete